MFATNQNGPVLYEVLPFPQIVCGNTLRQLHSIIQILPIRIPLISALSFPILQFCKDIYLMLLAKYPK